MKKYQYIEVHIGKFLGAKSEEHRMIIDDCAAKGYRYVGYIPTRQRGTGHVEELELIFEKEV